MKWMYGGKGDRFHFVVTVQYIDETRTYGIRCTDGGGVEDISPDRHLVRRLCRDYARWQAEPVHWKYLAQDRLAQQQPETGGRVFHTAGGNRLSPWRGRKSGSSTP